MLKKVATSLVPRRYLVGDLEQTHANSVLLTFDDGPEPGVTLQILDRLDAAGARGVFFVVGSRAEQEPRLVAEIVERGHVIANHTYSHFINAEPRYRRYREDLIRCQRVLEVITGKRPTLFRPPGGHLTISALLASMSLGLQMVRWSASSADYLCASHEEALACSREILAQARGRSIVLMHDMSRHSVTILDEILKDLSDRGHDLAAGVESLHG